MPSPEGRFLAFTAKSNPPQKQSVLRTQAGVRQAASLGKGGEPQSFVAIWDTGASATCISPKISQALGLGAISMATVHAAGNSYDSPVYRIDVLLPNRLVVTDIRALDVGSNNHVNYDGEVAPIRVGHLSKRAPLLVEKESLPFRRSSRLTT